MGSSSEDLFVHTQPQEDECDGDETYLELAKAITERKCRIDQKKEKLRVLINELKAQREQVKSVENEHQSLLKELEEVCKQRDAKMLNIKKAQETRETLEKNLCDLTNKVTFENEERKRKKDEYDAAIKDAQATWETYKEQWESLPLAKELRSWEVKVKKVNIALKQAEMDIADLKAKKKLKQKIAERRFQLDVVKLAEQYKNYHKHAEEVRELQAKIKEMQSLLVDIKSGKLSKQQLEPLQVSAGFSLQKEQEPIRSIPQTVQFTVPGIQVTSPPPAVNEKESAEGSSTFSWSNLLNSNSLLKFSKTPVERSVKPTPNTSFNHQTTEANSQTGLQKQKTTRFHPGQKSGTSLKLTNLLRGVSSPYRKPQVNVSGNREKENVTQREATKEKVSTKKALNVIPQSTKENTVIQNEKPSPIKMAKYEVGENLSKRDYKENINPKISNSSSKYKSYTSLSDGNIKDKPTTTLGNSKALTQNLMQTEGQNNQRKAPEPPIKNVYEQAKPTQTASANNQKYQTKKLDQPQKNYTGDVVYQNTSSDLQHQQHPDIQILMEPGSPAPDLIPVETNSQPPSQGNNSQTGSPFNFNLSGGSDFISPSDVDEATKMLYQRMASQDPYPGEEFSRMMAQKPNSEESVVRSQYFVDAHSLNTPPGDPGSYPDQSPDMQPFSPIIEGEFAASPSQQNIPSPPPGNSVDFGGSTAASSTSVFNFLGSSKSTTSFFDFI